MEPYRVNTRIHAAEVRVIADDGNLGVFPLDAALKMAEERKVD